MKDTSFSPYFLQWYCFENWIEIRRKIVVKDMQLAIYHRWSGNGSALNRQPVIAQINFLYTIDNWCILASLRGTQSIVYSFSFIWIIYNYALVEK